MRIEEEIEATYGFRVDPAGPKARFTAAPIEVTWFALVAEVGRRRLLEDALRRMRCAFIGLVLFQGITAVLLDYLQTEREKFIGWSVCGLVVGWLLVLMSVRVRQWLAPASGDGHTSAIVDRTGGDSGTVGSVG